MLTGGRPNAFNLADDLVEPFRPFVDRCVFDLAGPPSTWRDELTKEERRALGSILLDNCRLGSDHVSILVACEKVAASLVRAIEEKSADALILPEFASSGGQFLDEG